MDEDTYRNLDVMIKLQILRNLKGGEGGGKGNGEDPIGCILRVIFISIFLGFFAYVLYIAFCIVAFLLSYLVYKPILEEWNPPSEELNWQSFIYSCMTLGIMIVLMVAYLIILSALTAKKRSPVLTTGGCIIIIILTPVLTAYTIRASHASYLPPSSSISHSQPSVTSPAVSITPTPLVDTKREKEIAMLNRLKSEYSTAIDAWKRQEKVRQEIESEIQTTQEEVARLRKSEPTSPPKHQEREWLSANGKHKTLATLLKSDFASATLMKKDGSTVVVKKDSLSVEDIVIVEKAFTDEEFFKTQYRKWSEKMGTAEAKQKELQNRLNEHIRSAKAKPTEPTIEDARQRIGFSPPSDRVLTGENAGKLRLKCKCGENLLFKPELAGQKARCPSCKELVDIPRG